MTHTLTTPLVTNTPTIYAPSIAKKARGALGATRVRRVAAEPRLELAARGTDAYYAPAFTKRPANLTARHVKDVAAAKRVRFTPDSSSFSFQTEFGQARAASPLAVYSSGYIFDINFASGIAAAHI